MSFFTSNHASTQPVKSCDEVNSLRGTMGVGKKGKNDTYHMKSVSIAVVSSVSFLGNVRNVGVDVLYMSDPADKYAVQQLNEFGSKY